jgi:hypothetical protein
MSSRPNGGAACRFDLGDERVQAVLATSDEDDAGAVLGQPAPIPLLAPVTIATVPSSAVMCMLVS